MPLNTGLNALKYRESVMLRVCVPRFFKFKRGAGFLLEAWGKTGGKTGGIKKEHGFKRAKRAKDGC